MEEIRNDELMVEESKMTENDQNNDQDTTETFGSKVANGAIIGLAIFGGIVAVKKAIDGVKAFRAWRKEKKEEEERRKVSENIESEDTDIEVNVED